MGWSAGPPQEGSEPAKMQRRPQKAARSPIAVGLEDRLDQPQRGIQCPRDGFRRAPIADAMGFPGSPKNSGRLGKG